MTANRAHTPTTEEIRKGYIGEPPHFMDKLVGAEFDRWLAAHDAEVAATAEQRGAERALRALAHSLTAGRDPETDPRIFDPWDVAEILLARANKADQDRADRMEGDDG